MENKLFHGTLLCLSLVIQVTSSDDHNPLINHYADYESIHPSEYYSSDFELKDGTNVVFEAINELTGIKKPKAGFECSIGRKHWTKSPRRRVLRKITPALGRRCPGYRCVLGIRREGLFMKDTNELFPWTPWPHRHKTLQTS
ncbi:hypothetical protein Bca4012_014855 [Brassica carinata]